MLSLHVDESMDLRLLDRQVVSAGGTRNFIRLSMKQFEYEGLVASYQGREILTKACGALIDYLFREKAVDFVEIRCAVENERSCGIPERLGLSQKENPSQ